ncbi:MAG TPA: phospholipid carrier-dependent glycosyltransferase [Edaphobacter sp.]|nr:phospholipid carrier-dependent glycosyltransferase [Edaphobacter sp.]
MPPPMTRTDRLLPSPGLTWVIVVALLVVLATLLFTSVRQESQVFDEATHLFAGQEYWKHGDFGRNPEHPPLAKLIASAPVLNMGQKEPDPIPIPFFKPQDLINGEQQLYSGDADAILIRARMSIALFSLLLALLVFFAGREMFGDLAAIFALGLFVFEPVLLANGALITTDVPLACMFFASVYSFYRYVKRPTPARLGLCALATGLAIVTKHSGILVLPILFLLSLIEMFSTCDLLPAQRERRHRLLQLTVALGTILLVTYAIIWTIYGFRFAARPGGSQIVPPLAFYANGMTHALQRNLILFFARHHILPEAYLYGWVDILIIPSQRPAFVLGRHFASGQWFFFPAVFLIKSTLALLVLLVAAPFARTSGRRREFLFMTVPAAFFMLTAIFSMLNMGVRHLMPIFPFCIVIAGAVAASIASRSMIGRVAIAALLLFDVISSLHAFPDFLAYSNEIAGGPSRTYRLVTDADDDWGQGLKWTRRYLDEHPASDCWIVYDNPYVDPAYYGIPCKRLMTGFSHAVGVPSPSISPVLSGTFFLSSAQVEGHLWGPDSLNPYETFRQRKPDDEIEGITLVYRGTFDVPLLAAQTDDSQANVMLAQHRVPEALALAQRAAQEAPDSAEVNHVLGQVLLASGRMEEAKQAAANAVRLARANHPEYQKDLLK